MGEHMKEIKIRLGKDEHRRLRQTAKKNLRSMNKQVTAFVVDGLQREKSKSN